MCNTCGCGSHGDQVKFTIPGNKHAHKHGSDHDHKHGSDDLNSHKDHDHMHGHTHKHVHSHPHDHEHEHVENHEHEHEHTHKHSHTHDHENKNSRLIELELDVMRQNNLLAERNKGYFEGRNIFVINMVSSPGSGKTSLLENTINRLKDEIRFSVIEGDQQSMNDANRISATGAPVIQINTGNGCHLDAEMINKAVKQLNVVEDTCLVIENVGNLVCPALFNLGEAVRVVVISVTEGEDKPLKYPGMFYSSDICIINKTDLLPYVDFNVEKAREYALQINHHLKFFEVSAKTGEGMDSWYDWLRANAMKKPS